MACYRPLQAWQPVEGGPLVWAARPGTRELEISCGQCIGCRLKRSRDWAIRCVHEASLYEDSSFITLTYDDESVPVDGSLRYSDFQSFIRRLRKRVRTMRQRRTNETCAIHVERLSSSSAGVRFFMAGEYGEQFFRPHFHALLFGVSFLDRELLCRLPSGCEVFTSQALADLWSVDGKSLGFSSIGAVTFESAAYVARYCVKKVTGSAADEHYKRVDLETGEYYWLVPEFTHMSLKPGIGSEWYDKYGQEVHNETVLETRGASVVIDGRVMTPPRYYDKKLAAVDAFHAEYASFLRAERGKKFSSENSSDRLAVREKVASNRLKFKKRTL